MFLWLIVKQIRKYGVSVISSDISYQLCRVTSCQLPPVTYRVTYLHRHIVSVTCSDVSYQLPPVTYRASYFQWHRVTYLQWHIVSVTCSDLSYQLPPVTYRVNYLQWHRVNYLQWHIVSITSSDIVSVTSSDIPFIPSLKETVIWFKSSGGHTDTHGHTRNTHTQAAEWSRITTSSLKERKLAVTLTAVGNCMARPQASRYGG